MRRTALVARALVVERILSFLDKFIDAAMILALIIWGPLGCFVVGFVMSLVFCLSVLEGELRTGFTGVEHLKSWSADGDHSEKSWIHRATQPLLRWMFRSHWGMMFIGSVFYIESDYVTLILKRKDETRVSIFFRVMLPSVAWGILAWTLIYWASLEFAQWLWLELTGCSPAACLAKSEWQPVLEALRFVEGAYQTLRNLIV